MGEIRSTKGDMPNKDSIIICKICGNSIKGNEEIELCPECVSPFHKECWDKRGGCGNPNCSSFVKPVTDIEDATAKVVSLIIIKAKESLAKKEFEKALEFYKKALEYDSSNVESINGLILAENSVCSTKELLKKGIEFEKSDSYKTYAEKLPEENKKILEEIIQNRCQNKEKKKKKRKALIISVSSALAVILVAVCIWFATPMSRFNFEINENSVVITGVKFKNIRNAVIPKKIFGKPVTSIGNDAFSGCTRLTSVAIPNSVATIGDFAFTNCDNLTSVAIPNSVATIGDFAFTNCDNLTSVVIPKSVTTIGNGAFWDCTGLASVTIPNSVTSIGDFAFFGCTSLTRVDISDIGAWCNISFGYGNSNPLYYAKNLYLNGELVTDLVIPNNATSIGNYAFSGCTGLTSVEIPNSVTTIGDYAFSGCTGLTSVEIPNSVTTIGDYAFSGCTGLTSVEIPNSVTSIGYSAFSNCTGLTSIEIPNSVTTIGKYAFWGCTSLTSVVIPNSVTSIGYFAFEGCTNLTIYCEAESKPSGWDAYWNPSNCPVVWDSKRS